VETESLERVGEKNCEFWILVVMCGRVFTVCVFAFDQLKRRWFVIGERIPESNTSARSVVSPSAKSQYRIVYVVPPCVKLSCRRTYVYLVLNSEFHWPGIATLRLRLRSCGRRRGRGGATSKHL
jgi:hypothetical protein